MDTKQSENNILNIGGWYNYNQSLILFDMSNVNAALERLNVKPVEGILGADVLSATKAVIDYNRNGLYLKK